jgi:hypothetical protein
MPIKLTLVLFRGRKVKNPGADRIDFCHVLFTVVSPNSLRFRCGVLSENGSNRRGPTGDAPVDPVCKKRTLATLSVACCLRHLDGFSVRQIEILLDGVMQLFTLLSWPERFQALDGRQNKKQEISESA